MINRAFLTSFATKTNFALLSSAFLQLKIRICQLKGGYIPVTQARQPPSPQKQSVHTTNKLTRDTKKAKKKSERVHL